MDNILTTYETTHTMSNNLKEKSEQTILKLDTSKAYDILEWSFLEVDKRKLDFDV